MAARNLRAFRLGPKCGAARKRDGLPCEKHAMANGRCEIHGGRVPKGKDWHVRQWPDRASPDAADKLHRKLQDAERDARDRRRRYAAMTAEERAAHDAWHKAHKPGDPKRRRADRERRRQNAEAAKLLARPEAPKAQSPEERELADLIERARAELQRRLAVNDDEGILS